MWTFQELLMNCSWTIFFFHNKFLNSSWTVMVNCSWTLVHEPTMRVFYELFMNCSWTFMNVHEQFIKSWTTFHRGIDQFRAHLISMQTPWRLKVSKYLTSQVCIPHLPFIATQHYNSLDTQNTNNTIWLTELRNAKINKLRHGGWKLFSDEKMEWDCIYM